MFFKDSLRDIALGDYELITHLTPVAADLMKEIAALGAALKLNEQETLENLPYLLGALYPIVRFNLDREREGYFGEGFVAVAPTNVFWLDIEGFLSDSSNLTLDELQDRRFSHALCEKVDYNNELDYEVLPEIKAFNDFDFSGDALAYLIEDTHKFKAPISSEYLRDMLTSKAPIEAFKASEFGTKTNEELAKLFFDSLYHRSIYDTCLYVQICQHGTYTSVSKILHQFDELIKTKPRAALIWLMLANHHVNYFESVNSNLIEGLGFRDDAFNLDPHDDQGLANQFALEYFAAWYDMIDFFFDSLYELSRLDVYSTNKSRYEI